MKRSDIDIASGGIELTADEREFAERFAMALRRMDDGHRRAARSLLDAVEELARKHPRRAVPSLRLVEGGAQ